MQGTELARRVNDLLEIDSDINALEFRQHWLSWNRLAGLARQIRGLLDQAGLGPGDGVGIALRNRAPHVAALLGVLAGDFCVVTLSPFQPPALLAADAAELRLKALIADADDWAQPELRAAAIGAGTLCLGLEHAADGAVRLLPGGDRLGPGPFHAARPGCAIEMMTSGTTGPAKRIPLSAELALKSALDGARDRSGRLAPPPTAETAFRKAPALLAMPLVHASGMFNLLMNMLAARPLVLLEKFNVAEWVRAVATYKLKTTGVPPAAMRMLLDADVPREALASLVVVHSGASALPPEMQEEFETRYGIPVLGQYGATEWIGAIAGWTLDDHRAFASRKRGSVGRARPDMELRVVDPDSGVEQPHGVQGILEVRSRRGGADASWVPTSDVGSLDEDGFLWIHGRTDDVIIRGGFKVNGEETSRIIKRHPAVYDAIVLGLPDARLGQVPVCAAELRPGMQAGPAELEAFARANMTSYQVPARFLIVDALPRTVSSKIARAEVRALFAAAG